MRLTCLVLLAGASALHAQTPALLLNEQGYFTTRGLDVLAYHNTYAGLFSDEKKAGIELIHHGRRIATNGDVRLSNTPEQWDPAPRLDRRDVADNRVRAVLSYPDYGFSYRVEVQPQSGGILVSVQLDEPLPKTLDGRAGFNLEFLPSVYFGKTYVMDMRGGVFPQHPTGPMRRGPLGRFEAAPLASGDVLVLAPEDAERRITIESLTGPMRLYDGRNKAQNGWFVVRAMLPADKTGTVVQWRITPNLIANWTRAPVIAHSQIGYHTMQRKVAVIELDPNYAGSTQATLLRIGPNGSRDAVLSRPIARWGRYLRYDYGRFDFSSVHEPGLYMLEFGGVQSEPFRIDADVYRGSVWQSTLDTFLPVQMDHVLVNDRYRVWHGASHLDDARQAPVNHEHFDLYAQGPTTDTRFQGGEHIPGLNTGGWYDAGDFDIRTQSQYAVVSGLVMAHETFDIDWDQTTVDQAKRYVDIGVPDGVPDIIQQIEHGTLWLINQYRAVGHAVNGVVEPTLEQYTHLGDAVTKTDNQPGTADDRLAFTSRSTALDYGSIAALAAASRVLRGYNDALARECLETATRVWTEEQARPPATFRHGNTTGGRLEDEELKATVELLITSKGERRYAQRVRAMLPYIEQNFEASAVSATRALPFMDASYRSRIEAAVRAYRTRLDAQVAANPFGVPITTGGWGGSGAVVGFAIRNYILHRAFPSIIGPEHTLRGFEYLLGTHPSSSVSLVSGIGAHSKTNAYGNNRADYSFIPGGIVPGIVIVGPDLPELMEDWPFLWYESEYVIPMASSFIFLANAVADLTN